MRGKFITLEGVEGTGKTTHLKFIFEYLQKKHIPILATREPGGTPLGEDIRTLLLQKKEDAMVPEAELLLIFAARAQHITRLILPALEAGTWVICDRFIDSTYAYQGAGRGLSLKKIKQLEKLMTDPLVPDLTLLFDVSLTTSLARIKKQRNLLDRFESEAISFFERVRKAYLTEATDETQRFCVIQAEDSIEKVQTQVMEALNKVLL